MQLPHDTGPIYKETLMSRFPVEPFNTYSNLLFLAIIIYFGFKIFRRPKQHIFLSVAVPVIFIGYIGGTIYHATRSAEVWLYMDWVPIMLMCLAATIYFVYKTTPRLGYRILWIALMLTANFGIRALNVPHGLQISIGYVVTALTVLIPIFAYLYTTKWKNTQWVLLAIASFVVAIIFRTADKHQEFLEMGSHWLWHSFGAIAVFFLMNYIYKDDCMVAEHKNRIVE